MSKFRIIPVIDILNSVAVHAIKGERSNYKPVESKLIKSTDPLKLVEFFREKFNFNEFYIADLDGIINKNPNVELISKILENTHIRLMLDPGIRNQRDVIIYSKLKVNKLILGLETIKKIEIIIDALRLLGSKKIIVSIDLYQGKILSSIPDLKNKNSIEIIKIIDELGVKEIIILDLFRVGQKIGDLPDNYLKIKDNFKKRTLVGGGIKNINDILEYKRYGFSGVLIATILHEGIISSDDIREINQL